MPVRTYVTDEVCPNCKVNIFEELAKRVYQDGGGYFDFDCPSCNHPLEIETRPVPAFGIYPVEGCPTPRAADVGDVLPKIDAELLECGHSISYIVYSERRNYCGICERDAHRKNPAFNSPRRR